MENNEWKECKLGELGVLQRGRSRHRPRYAFHLYGGEHPFIQTGDIREGQKYITQYSQTYSDAGLAQSKMWPKGTLCITIAANIAELGILSFDSCFPDSVLGFIPDASVTDLDFIYYMLVHFQKELKHIGEGSVQDNINLGTFQNILFPIPPLPEQRAIAEVLSSLDDKIALLHRQNKTLEAMAETLCRQWFVEGADEAWEEGSLLELIELVGGGTPKTSVSEYWDGDVPWLAGGDIANSHKGFVLSSEKKISQLGLDNSAAKLLPKYATVVSARGTVGKYCLLANEMTFSQSNYGILPKVEGCYFFTYLLINYMVEELQSAAYGSVFDTITTATFRDAKLRVPSKDVILKFENEIKTYFDKQYLNKHQICALEKLRDILLPKLMDGEVKIKVGDE